MNSLLKAVLDDDISTVAKLCTNSQELASVDELGFTPLEIAQLLGRYDCMELFGIKLPHHFLVQKKGESSPNLLSRSAFEEFFGITYRPYLYFPSYSTLRRVVNNCPYILRSKRLASENYKWFKSYEAQIAKGETAPIAIKWINDHIGYGTFAAADIAAGDFIGEYTGLVKRLYRRRKDSNPYCFHYPTRFWSLKYYAINALGAGNVMRFANHSNRPNLLPLCAVDKGILHMIFVAVEDIAKGKELVFRYQ